MDHTTAIKNDLAILNIAVGHQLKNECDVLDVAACLELGAVNTYLGVITAFKNPALGKIAAHLAADEVGHVSLLNFDLKRPFGPI